MRAHGADAARYGAMEGFLPLDWPGRTPQQTHVECHWQPLVGRRPTLVRV